MVCLIMDGANREISCSKIGCSTKFVDLLISYFISATYSSSEALHTLEEEKIIGYIPNFGQYKSLRKGFSYAEGLNKRSLSGR